MLRFIPYNRGQFFLKREGFAYKTNTPYKYGTCKHCEEVRRAGS